MQKRWISGLEVKERFGIPIKEIADACFGGTLKAYKGDEHYNETNKRIYEETKVDKVPFTFYWLYRNEMPLKQFIKRGVNIIWDKDAYKNISVNYQSVFYNDVTFVERIFNGDCLPFTENNGIENIYEHKFSAISFDNGEAIYHQPCVFPFNFKDYFDRECPFCNEYKEDSMWKKYKEEISNMKFKPDDIKSCFFQKKKENQVIVQGGSRPETDKISATKEACKKVADAFADGFHAESLDLNGRINFDIFKDLVISSMEAGGNKDMYQKTAANDFYKSSDKLKPFKLHVGGKLKYQ